MIEVYHGSYIEILKPDLRHSRDSLDFGKGFYVTKIKEQAEKWSIKNKKEKSIVSVYELDNDMFKQLFVIDFKYYSEYWLDFVLKCRNNIDDSKYDIVIGPMADDKVYNTIKLYMDGKLNKPRTIRQLEMQSANNQFCFRTERALKILRFKGSYKV